MKEVIPLFRDKKCPPCLFTVQLFGFFRDGIKFENVHVFKIVNIWLTKID